MPASARRQAADSSLLRLVGGITSATESYAAEKLYVQTDRPSYAPGDTLWFKAYLFDAAFLYPSPQSGMLYLEIAAPDNEVIKRTMVVLRQGLGWGYFALDETVFPAGPYTLRAYTNWMRNFSRKGMFQRQITINDYSGDAWLVHARFRAVPGNGSRVESHLAFVRQDEQPLSFRNLQVALTDGNRTLNKDKFRTDVKGGLELNFKIPANLNDRALSLVVMDLKEGSSAPRTVPVILEDASPVDLQFMPEGGELIAGISERVGFKAVGGDGMGCDVSGTIYDSGNRVVDSFRSTHLGMGYFEFVPRKKESYTAVINTGTAGERRVPLPEVRSAGLALQVSNPLYGDSVEIRILSAPGEPLGGGSFYLVAAARGIGCFGARLRLENGQESFRVNKSLFPPGITRFTVYGADGQPVCQRMIFLLHTGQLKIGWKGRDRYGVRDEVKFGIKLLDNAGTPLRGSFSVAVTDDHKVYIDSLKRNSLVSDILLTSDLNGYVEEPGYYFPQQMTAEIWSDLDKLLLTQGWVIYSRDTTAAPKYKAERFFSIRGGVTNILNKPVAGSQVVLFSKKPLMLEEATTAADGTFVFDQVYPVDTASFMLQARNKKGRSFNVGIEVDAFEPPVFDRLERRVIPWYVNLDTAHYGIVQAQVADREKTDKLLGKHVLKEVVIVGQKAVSGSKNLNGPGGSDFAMNQSDMEKEGKATLGEVLRQKVKGFRLGGRSLDQYLINTELAHPIIDGVELDFFKPEEVSYKDFYKPYLDYLTAEDIKGIEVMTSSRYTGKYYQRYLDPMAKPFEHVFIEVTTYSGNGAFMRKTPGVFLYKPAVAFSTPAHFYSPKYTVKTDRPLPDVRSTIYWEPDIITDDQGEAEISFYTADKPGTYTVIIEGTDMAGDMESVIKKIVIE